MSQSDLYSYIHYITDTISNFICLYIYPKWWKRTWYFRLLSILTGCTEQVKSGESKGELFRQSESIATEAFSKYLSAKSFY